MLAMPLAERNVSHPFFQCTRFLIKTFHASASSEGWSQKKTYNYPSPVLRAALDLEHQPQSPLASLDMQDTTPPRSKFNAEILN